MSATQPQVPELRAQPVIEIGQATPAGERADSALAAKEATAAWARTRARLQLEVPGDRFDAWLARLDLVAADGGGVRLSAPTSFLRRWVEQHYLDQIRAAWHAMTGVDAVVRIVVRSCTVARPPTAVPTEPVTAAAPAPAQQPSILGPVRQPEGPHRLTSPLDPAHTFDTFVAAESNRLAIAAARMVAAGNTHGTNPLFVHSPVGLGKTHLLQAIVAAAGARAVYVTAEKFGYVIAQEMRRVGTFAAAPELFAADVVAIDDIGFLTSRALRLEFARVVTRLVGDGKQLVVAADRAPHDLGDPDDRMCSRLAAGLVVEIAPMDEQLRREILLARIAALAGRGTHFSVPSDVVDMIAQRVTRDGRDLEGAVNRLALLAATGSAIDVAAAERSIRDLIHEAAPPVIRIEMIQAVVARHYNVSRIDLLSTRRTANIVRPRQVAMYLAKELTARSLPEIGRRFGGRDHTTVLHAVRKLANLRTQDHSLDAELTAITREIAAFAAAR